MADRTRPGLVDWACENPAERIYLDGYARIDQE